jgi:hypothetical protein
LSQQRIEPRFLSRPAGSLSLHRVVAASERKIKEKEEYDREKREYTKIKWKKERDNEIGLCSKCDIIHCVCGKYSCIVGAEHD